MISRRHTLFGLASSVTLIGALRGASAAGTQQKAAIALPGSITDGGWSEAGHAAMERAKKELGYDIAFTEKVLQPEQVEVLSDYARRGYNVIFGHGGEFQDAVERVASRFPQTNFVVTNGLKAAKNVATADFYFSQPAYLLGYLAGKMTKTGKIGLIAAQKFKFTTDTVAGYEAGAKAARPDTGVLVTWTGDWDDVAKGKEAAFSQISQGADILWPTMDSATTGSLQAVREKGAKALGLYYDAITKWPDIMLQSSILDVSAVIFDVLKLAGAEGLQGKNYKFDLRNADTMRLGSYHSSVPQAVVAEVSELERKIKAGELVIQPV